MSKKKKTIFAPPKRHDPPEDSVALRVVVFAMSVLCILASCVLVDTAPMVTVFYVFLAISGSYLSYLYRHDNNLWLTRFAVVGSLVVAGNFFFDLMAPFRTGHFELLAPVVHQVAGTLGCYSFEMKGRYALNFSSAIALILLCLVADVGRSLLLGVCVILYVCLGAVQLYYDCLSRTNQTWLTKPILRAQTSSRAQTLYSRHAGGNVVLTLFLVPLLTGLLFLVLPRFNGIWDLTEEAIRNNTPPELNYSSDQMRPDISKRKPYDYEKHRTQPSKSEGAPGDVNAQGQKRVTATTAAANPAATTAVNASTSGAPSASATAQHSRSEQLKDDSHLDIAYHAKGAQSSNILLMKIVAKRTFYVRSLCYDYFDGRVWSADASRVNETKEFLPTQGSPYVVSQAQSLSPLKFFPGVDLTQEYRIEENLSAVLPVAYMPQEVTYDGEKINVDSYGVIRASHSLTKGTHYKVKSKVPVYNLDYMRQIPRMSAFEEDSVRYAQSSNLQLPTNFSSALSNKARTIMGDTGNWFTQAERLSDYFKTHYKYKIHDNELDSDATDPVGRFVFKAQAGDCQDFATAFTLMCRSSGIPARLVRGYLPGKLNDITGLREVRASDMHGWSEIYLPDYGWIPFDSTPNGSLPAQAAEERYSFSTIAKKIESVAKGHDVEQNQHSTATPDQEISWRQIMEYIFGGGILLVITWLLIIAIKEMIRKSKADANLITAEVKLFRKVVKDLKAVNVIRSPADTGDDLRERLRATIIERQKVGLPIDLQLESKLERFLEAYAAAYFGNKDRLEELQILQKEISDMTKNRRRN
jgi:transglutaminase-like putative cysteine protease